MNGRFAHSVVASQYRFSARGPHAETVELPFAVHELNTPFGDMLIFLLEREMFARWIGMTPMQREVTGRFLSRMTTRKEKYVLPLPKFTPSDVVRNSQAVVDGWSATRK